MDSIDLIQLELLRAIIWISAGIIIGYILGVIINKFKKIKHARKIQNAPYQGILSPDEINRAISMKSTGKPFKPDDPK